MRSVGPVGVALLTILLLVTLWSPFPRSDALFALLVGLTPAAALLVVAIGTRRQRGGRWLGGSVVAALTCILGGFLALGALRSAEPLDSWFLGLPAVLGVMIWLLAVVPVILLGLFFGWGFPRWRPSSNQMERLRAVLARPEHDDG